MWMRKMRIESSGPGGRPFEKYGSKTDGIDEAPKYSLLSPTDPFIQLIRAV